MGEVTVLLCSHEEEWQVYLILTSQDWVVLGLGMNFVVGQWPHNKIHLAIEQCLRFSIMKS